MVCKEVDAVRRYVVTLAMGATALALAACSGKMDGSPQPLGGSESQGSSASRRAEDLDSVDLCRVLSAQELSSLGVATEGEREEKLGEIGCVFDGDPYTLGLKKDPDDGLDFYEKRASMYDVFERNKVNGRPGAVVIPAGGEGNGGCTEVFEFGSGSIAVDVVYRFGKYEGVDVCAEALRVAQLVESKLPR